ncbi:MAG: hypothetical protein WDZ75_01090 [Candidatus Paceibacterota bacterium]
MLERDEQAKIDRLLRLSEENNRMLKAMHRAQVWARFFRFIYWAVIIALTIVAYYYLQPYLEQAQTLYDEINQTVGGIKEGTTGFMERFQ